MALERVIGIDIGSQETTIVAEDGEIIRTETGSIAFPTLVSFVGTERFVGETAQGLVFSNADSTITSISSLYGKTAAQWQAQPVCKHSRVACEEGSGGLVCFRVQFAGEPIVVHSTHILSMWLKYLHERVVSIYGESVRLALSVPPSITPVEAATLHDAGQLAGIPNLLLSNSIEAIMELYRLKQGLEEGESERGVCVIEMGHTQTTIFVFRLSSEGLSLTAQTHDPTLGGVNFDNCLFEHFARLCNQRYGVQILHQSKKGARLFAACEKIRKVLSTIPECRQQVENLTDAGDVTLPLTREDMASICAEQVERFTALLEETLASALAQGVDLTTIQIEVLGGCTRMPVLREAITAVFAAHIQQTHVILGAKLDDVSVARGTALLGKQFLRERVSTTPLPMETVLQEESSPMAVVEEVKATEEQATPNMASRYLSAAVMNELEALEERVTRFDTEAKACSRVRNELEAMVLELRGAMRTHEHRDKLDAAVVTPILEECEAWLCSGEARDGGLEIIRNNKMELESRLTSACREFNAAISASNAETERQLEEDSKKFQAEQGDTDADDLRDSRIRKPERMKLVSKNKDEGTELFKAGNFRLAAARYHKALTHAAKLFDLSPEETATLSSLKLSLHLNLAQCYLKLQNWEQVIRNSNDALELDPNSSKALFRRATAYESMRDFEKAQLDVRRCLELTPDDSLVVKMNARVQAAITKEKEKEKQMWGKAFSAK